MAYGRRSTASSFFENFTLNPLPYPVLIILAVIFVFLGTSWFMSYDSAVEAAQEQMGWVLIALPIVILIIVRWLSTIENPEGFFATSPFDRRRRTHYNSPSEGSSPWGVAALIVLVLLLLQYQSVFHDGWFMGLMNN